MNVLLFLIPKVLHAHAERNTVDETILGSMHCRPTPRYVNVNVYAESISVV